MAEELLAVGYDGFTAHQVAILEALRIGNTRAAAYRSAGVSKTTFYRWLGEDGTFRDYVERAESQAEMFHVSVVSLCAQGGALKKRLVRQRADGSYDIVEEYALPDWKASAWWLEHRRREWLADRALDVGRLTDAQLHALLDDEDQKGAGEPDPAPEWSEGGFAPGAAPDGNLP